MFCLLKLIKLLIIIKSTVNLKLLWIETWHTSLLKHDIQVFHVFFFIFYFTEFHSKFECFFLCFTLWNLLHQNSDSESSCKSVLAKILCVLFTLRSLFASDSKKLVNRFFKLCEWSKNMWSCATTDTAHAQRSYLTAARLTFAEWRFALRRVFTCHPEWVGLTLHYTRTEN